MYSSISAGRDSLSLILAIGLQVQGSIAFTGAACGDQSPSDDWSAAQPRGRSQLKHRNLGFARTKSSFRQHLLIGLLCRSQSIICLLTLHVPSSKLFFSTSEDDTCYFRSRMILRSSFSQFSADVTSRSFASLARLLQLEFNLVLLPEFLDKKHPTHFACA